MWAGDFHCDQLDFEGTLSFLCPPLPNSGNDSVVLRYDISAIAVVPGTDLFMVGRMASDRAAGITRESRGDRHRWVVARAQ